jgi:glutamate racemase
MNNVTNPIGVFDSGVGGLSLLRCIREQLPGENLIYIADSRYAPYGNRSKEYIENRSLALSEFLIEQKAKAIVVACNTATAAAISKMRSIFPVPIIGMEPGVKPALSITRTGTVGILATTETIRSEKFQNLISRFCNECEIVTQDCPGLVEQVEKMDLSGPDTLKMVRKYVSALLEKGADTIVLGCTHYLFLTKVIKKVAGKDITVIDTGNAVAREVVRRLLESGLMAENNKTGKEQFWTSGIVENNQVIINRLWGDKVIVRSLPEDMQKGRYSTHFI